MDDILWVILLIFIWAYIFCFIIEESAYKRISKLTGRDARLASQEQLHQALKARKEQEKINETQINYKMQIQAQPKVRRDYNERC